MNYHSRETICQTTTKLQPNYNETTVNLKRSTERFTGKDEVGNALPWGREFVIVIALAGTEDRAAFKSRQVTAGSKARPSELGV